MVLSRYRDIVLPCFKSIEFKTTCVRVLDLLNEISFISYLPVHIYNQYKEGLILRLRILCFCFLKNCGFLFERNDGTTTNGFLYLHNIAEHFTELFEQIPLRCCLEETGEGFLAQVKRICKRFTNRTPQNCSYEILVRINTERNVKMHCGETSKESNSSSMKQFIKQKTWPEIILDPSLIKTYGKDLELFLETLPQECHKIQADGSLIFETISKLPLLEKNFIYCKKFEMDRFIF